MSGLFGLGGLLSDLPANGLGRLPQQPTLGLSLLGGMVAKPTRVYPCFELYIDDRGSWRWRFLASNYKIIADSGEGYNNFDDAKHGIALLQGAANAPSYIGKD
ncbi:YegP family protein [Mesorhizobium cantuariense]|uniref:YegP family protein n=1 Tax=Mesorhizobium cantuariense TaxID=1300275 RepID=A0ABV7MW59_9HYPH